MHGPHWSRTEVDKLLVILRFWLPLDKVEENADKVVAQELKVVHRERLIERQDHRAEQEGVADALAVLRVVRLHHNVSRHLDGEHAVKKNPKHLRTAAAKDQ